MGELLTYLMAASCGMIVFVLIHKLLFERETFHRLNRIGWLLVLIIPLVLPFIDWNFSFGGAAYMGENMNTITIQNSAQMSYEATKECHTISFSFIYFIMILYWIGVALFSLKLLVSYVILIRKLRNYNEEITAQQAALLESCKAHYHYSRKVHLKVVNDDTPPFSWMGYIVISKHDLTHHGEEILLHEMAHLHERHSYDLVFIDWLSIFFWFNPAVWIARREMVQVHEYSADAWVLKSSVDQRPQFKATQNGESSHATFIHWLNSNLQYPAEAKLKKIEGTVIVEFVVEKDGSISNITIPNEIDLKLVSEDDPSDVSHATISNAADPLLATEAKRVIESSPNWLPAVHNGKAVRSFYHLPIKFSLQ